MQKQVSIILINYNGLAFNIACINSLLQQSYTCFEILFVDNDSHDWSVAEVEKDFSSEIAAGKIKVIKNDENHGFAQWNNIGVLHADVKSEYICLLNNDTTVPTDRLQELVIGMESDPMMGLVWSFVLDKWAEDNLRDLYFNQKKWWINNYIFETSFKDLSPKEIETWIFYTTWIGGCALMYKKHLVDRPFPWFYFAYTEDTFLSICILLQWYKLATISKSIVNHFWSGSFGKEISVFKAFHGTKNAICNNIILHSRKNFTKLSPILTLYMLVKVWSSSPLIRAKWLWKALSRCEKNKDLILAERKRVQSMQTISDDELLKQLSPTIFENIYFMKIAKRQEKTLAILNNICQFYFKVFHIWQGR